MSSDYLVLDNTSEIYKFSDLNKDNLKIIDSSLVELSRSKKILKLAFLSFVRLFSSSASRYIHSTIYNDLKINKNFSKSINIIKKGDSVVFINPTICIINEILYLKKIGADLSIFFADPVTRCGFNFKEISTLKENKIKIFSYSKMEQKKYRISFIPCFVPKRIKRISYKYDAVYVGSFSFFRLYYYFQLKLFGIINKKKILFLLVLNSKVLRFLTFNLLSDKVDPNKYLDLCSKSKAIIDITEPDADGWNPRIAIAYELDSVLISNKNYFKGCVDIDSHDALNESLDKNRSTWHEVKILNFLDWFELIKKDDFWYRGVK